MKGLCRIALAAVVLAACGGDAGITEPLAPTAPPPVTGGILALGVDSTTGASIETNKDDYSPGEVVHLVGRGWAAGETVNLHMTEQPNTHADVDTNIVADASGGFSVHFYDVQTHDLGVTFTLTATGQTSHSVAVATFTDGDITSLTITQSNCTTPQSSFALNATVCAVVTTAGNSTETLRFTWTRPNSTTIVVSGVSTAAVAGVQTATNSQTANQNGTWTVAACRTNNAGNCVGTTFTATFTVGNIAPTANAGGAYDAVNEGSPLQLNGSGSDTDGTISGYSWTYTKNTGHSGATCQFSSATAEDPTFTCNDNGTFTVSLTVTDNNGATSAASTASVTVNNVAPAATGLTAPSPQSPGASFTVTLNGADDVSANDETVGLSYAFDCGSGTFDSFDNTASRSCTAGSPGSQTVRGKVRDKEGAESAAYTASVAISNIPPTASIGMASYSGNEESPINISGGGNDPDGGSVTREWSTNAPAGVCDFGSTSSSPTTVTCHDNGNWTLTLKVTDDEGAFTTATASLNVANVSPVIGTHTAGGNVNEGTSITFAVSNITDVSPVDQAAPFQYAFKCGAGSYGGFSGTSTTSCPAGDGPGSVTIYAKVRDKDNGESAEVSATFNVQNTAPSITGANNNSPVNEGSNATMTVTTVSDAWAPDVATPEYAFACNGGAFGDYSTINSTSCPTVDGPGSVTIKAKVRDKDGAESAVFEQTVNVLNVAPTVTGVTAPASVMEGGTIAFSATGVTDPSTLDQSAGFTFEYSCDGGPWTGTASCAALDGPSNVTVAVRATDKDGGVSAVKTAVVAVTNVAPTVTGVNAPAFVLEGASITFSASGVTDPSTADVVFTYDFSCDNGATWAGFSNTNSGSCPAVDGPATITVAVRARDKDGGISLNKTASVTVNNVAPTLTSISGSLVPLAVGSSASVTLGFTDPAGTYDTYSALINWDNGAGEAGEGAITSGGSKSKTYTSAGIYTVCARIQDSDGAVSNQMCFEYFVVYDPNGSFVTGGGWIDSPAGAYVTQPTMSGKATFGFVSKYQPGRTVPQGNTEFNFHSGGLEFKSTAYEWLVVAGTRAQYKGVGTISGQSGTYGFLLTAIDNGNTSGGINPDKFRIKIWQVGGAVVYDNQMGQLEDSDAATSLSGGSIVIHNKK